MVCSTLNAVTKLVEAHKHSLKVLSLLYTVKGIRYCKAVADGIVSPISRPVTTFLTSRRHLRRVRRCAAAASMFYRQSHLSSIRALPTKLNADDPLNLYLPFEVLRLTIVRVYFTLYYDDSSR